jgi:aminoglycoside phosphotransferase family enzyme
MTEAEINELTLAVSFEGETVVGQLEETHISWVILTPEYAFKIKKPIKLSFLDFSTLALRKFYCDKELELNRRFTNIYLSVQPITKINNRWYIGSHSRATIDYCVVMKRMANDRRMDVMLQAETIDPELIGTLADRVALFHKNALKIFSPFDLAIAKNTFNDIFSVTEFVSSSIGTYYSDIVSRGIIWSDRFLASHARRFQQRIDEGFQRDVHGDLHAGNIFLYPDPVIFDCVEFNDQFRCIDVLYEIAYLCMDFESNRHNQFSEVFIWEYSKQFAAFGPAEDRLLFKYFKALRANVRAKVHAISARDEDNPADVLRHSNDVKRYLEQLNRYIVGD